MWFRGVVDSGVRVEETIDRQALAKSCIQRSCLLRSLGKELHAARFRKGAQTGRESRRWATGE